MACLTQTAQHYAQIVESLKPQGALGVIDDMTGLDAMALKSKAISLHWELMFTRSMFETPDMHLQGQLLADVAALIDAGRVKTTANTNFGRIDAANPAQGARARRERQGARQGRARRLLSRVRAGCARCS